MFATPYPQQQNWKENNKVHKSRAAKWITDIIVALHLSISSGPGQEQPSCFPLGDINN